MRFEDTQYKTEVMLAYLEGMTIQAKSKAYSEEPWRDVANPLWNWTIVDFRVKPEPQVMYAVTYQLPDGTIGELLSYNEGYVALPTGATYIKTTKYTEVLDD